MIAMSPKTIEAIYENGLLRPVEPIRDSSDQIYLVTVLSIDAFRAKLHPLPAGDVRGKYRGYLSSADDFARAKQAEKTLER